MRIRAILVLPILACLVILTPLAYADPPDPTWIDGIYDDGDFDDVVTSLIWAVSAVELDLLASLTPLPVLTLLVQPAEPSVRSKPAGPSFLSRSPPLA